MYRRTTTLGEASHRVLPHLPEVVEKTLYGKQKNEDENVIDLDTVPQNFCLRKEGKAREVLALKLIVDKIMECAEASTITFHDDVSRKQGKIQPGAGEDSFPQFLGHSLPLLPPTHTYKQTHRHTHTHTHTYHTLPHSQSFPGKKILIYRTYLPCI